MEPIIPITQKPKVDGAPARGTLADLIACIIAAIAAFIALAYSALFLSRFLENDTHFWGVVSAFLLCFGVGALGYIPASITSVIARKAYRNGANSRDLIFVILLLLPWIILSLALVFVSNMPKIYSVIILIIAALLTAWALISLQKI